jgi:hypothetical protein
MTTTEQPYVSMNLNEKIEIILRQTDYTEDVAREKLEEMNGDYIKVIKSFLGIIEKKESNKIKSVNQEIYKQLRYKLDESMRDYNERKKQSEKEK